MKKCTDIDHFLTIGTFVFHSSIITFLMAGPDTCVCAVRMYVCIRSGKIYITLFDMTSRHAFMLAVPLTQCRYTCDSSV